MLPVTNHQPMPAGSCSSSRCERPARNPVRESSQSAKPRRAIYNSTSTSPSTRVASLASGLGGGPALTAPVRSNTPPWHGLQRLFIGVPADAAAQMRARRRQRGDLGGAGLHEKDDLALDDLAVAILAGDGWRWEWARYRAGRPGPRRATTSKASGRTPATRPRRRAGTRASRRWRPG